MKKTLLFFALFGFVVSLSAQTFSDDFESYNVGGTIAASSSDWTTWSGGTAGEDALITDEQAHSGSNSLKFHGVSDGGPQDVVLPFPGKLTEGSFDLEMYIYVKENNQAYINLQGEVSIGTKWTEDFYFNPDGSLTGTRFSFVGSYTQNQWLKFKVSIDLTHNIWKIYIDDVFQGSYINSLNYIASMDIFPIDDNSDFYIDDVSYTYDATTPVLPTLNATLNTISFNRFYLLDSDITGEITVRNTGTEVINSFDLSILDNSNVSTISFSDLNITSLNEHTLDLSGFVANAGENEITATVSNVNGGADADDLDNELHVVYTGIVPAPNRKVLIEEGTGTWCQWCPRGAVFMDMMDERYPDYFVGIAVHSGDPMTIDGYAEAVGYIAFPQMSNERTEIFGFGLIDDVEAKFFPRLQTTPPAKVFSGAKYNATTRVLSIASQADFTEDATEQYKLAVILTEDNVTGTESGYDQANAYAGSSFEMGGYENLPTTVPASQMVYQHVGRALISPFNGMPNSLPSDAANGNSYDYSMPEYTIPDEFDVDQIHIITLLINANNQVVNVNSQTIAEALDVVLSGSIVETERDFAEVYPNPFSGQTSIFLSLESSSNVDLTVVNAIGQVVLNKNFGILNGKNNLDFDASQLTKGIYSLQINTNNKIITKRIVVE